jgi:hypothetical protein
MSAVLDLADLKATEQILRILGSFSKPDQERIVRWVSEKLDLGSRVPHSSPRATSIGAAIEERAAAPSSTHSSVGEFLASARAKTDTERVLAVATYLQEYGGQTELTGAQINSELRHMGHGVSNITDVINTLKDKKPQLMIQTRKEGTTKQARKKYKVTAAGIEFMRGVTNVEGDDIGT